MKNDAKTSVSSTVSQVIDEFVTAMRADDEIENNSIDRLEEILRKDAVPKPDEINTALFDPSADGEV